MARGPPTSSGRGSALPVLAAGSAARRPIRDRLFRGRVDFRNGHRHDCAAANNVRPVFHYSVPRVRAHVFLCMLACCVEWHMRQKLGPMLFDDEYLDEASASRASPVLKAVRSRHDKSKEASRTAGDGLPLHGFRTLLQELGTPAYNATHTRLNPKAKIILTTRPTPLQAKAFAPLGVNPACTQ